MPEDEDLSVPVPVPRTVSVATVLAIVAGAIFVLISVANMMFIDQQIAQSKDQYNAAIAQCVADVGGIGDQVMANPPADRADQAKSCASYKPLTQDVIDSARSTGIATGVVIGIFGLISILGGWYLRRGAFWARRVLVGVTALLVVATMLLRISNLFLLIGTLALLITVALCYLASGGVYFARIRARRRA